jgi:hypothetical protein
MQSIANLLRLSGSMCTLSPHMLLLHPAVCEHLRLLPCMLPIPAPHIHLTSW